MKYSRNQISSKDRREHYNIMYNLVRVHVDRSISIRLADIFAERVANKDNDILLCYIILYGAVRPSLPAAIDYYYYFYFFKKSRSPEGENSANNRLFKITGIYRYRRSSAPIYLVYYTQRRHDDNDKNNNENKASVRSVVGCDGRR